jgi:hypothetical protein
MSNRGLKPNYYIISLVILALASFFVYSWFISSVIEPQAEQHDEHRIFSWPDAMANNFFIDNYIKHGSFVKEEPYNVALLGLIHPRSTNVFNGDIVPTGFLGMIVLYGWLGKIFTAKFIIYLTPLLASLCSLFFYGLVKRLINARAAFIASFMLLTLAPFWYYANLSMLNTIPMIFCLLAGFYVLVKQSEIKSDQLKLVLTFAGGLLISFAIFIRYIEFIWIVLLVLVLWLFYFRKTSLMQIAVFVFGAAIPLVTLLYYNYEIYGEVFTVGYLKMNSEADLFGRLPGEFAVQNSNSILDYIKFLIIPFGFNPKAILKTAFAFVYEFLNPYFFAFVIGGVYWLYKYVRKQLSKAQKTYFWMALLSCCWLIFFYGNWKFIDPLVLKNNTIGSSYARYWLPVYIMMLPFIAFWLDKVFQLKALKAIKISLVTILLLGLASFSFHNVYQVKGDGLFNQKKVITSYYQQYDKVTDLIEDSAIIINNRADKLFFPNYRMVMFELNYAIFPIIEKIVKDVPFYYYTLMPDKDIEFINDRKIGELGLKLTEPVEIQDNFRLFKLTKTE